MTTKVIQVGVNGQTFTPSNVTAKVGDTIQWLFPTDKPHSVVQSQVANSCTKKLGGFASNTTVKGQFAYVIGQSSGNLYYFCSVGSHCENGMKGEILVQSASAPSPYPSPKNSAASDSNQIILFMFIYLFA